jgi:hypothetical protein
MAIKLTLPLLLLVLAGCRLIPGGDNDIHYFETEHKGIATLNRVIEQDDKTLLDFSWQADNSLGSTKTDQQLDTKQIAGLPADFNFQVGAQMPLSVVQFFKQRGSSTPQQLRSSWFFDAENSTGNSALWNYRPPRCINQ